MTAEIKIKEPICYRLFWSQTQQEFFLLNDEESWSNSGRLLFKMPDTVIADFLIYIQDRRAAEEPISYQEMLFHLKDFIANH